MGHHRSRTHLRVTSPDTRRGQQLAEATVRLGFANVIDAFHVSRADQPTQTRFFVDERASRQGITLTDHLRPDHRCPGRAERLSGRTLC